LWNAASEERIPIRTEAAKIFKRVSCKFGMKEGVLLCCTIGANEKGGLDELEFAKHVVIMLRKLYPDTMPKKGKWVIRKCDGGHGRMNVGLFASLRLDGIHLFPGIRIPQQLPKKWIRITVHSKECTQETLIRLSTNELHKGR
jgi:hypothetical protein